MADKDDFLTELELKIQQRAVKKDKNFILAGPWKKFIRKQNGFLVYAVDGEWVRNNLSVLFEHGGHGYVHEFIPHNEIWGAAHHPKDCRCQNVRPDRKMSPEFFDSTVIHEITEHKEMARGKTFHEAHPIALQKEAEVGILKDPYQEVD